MNQPSLDRFSPQLARGGLLVLNTSMAVLTTPLRSVKVLEVPATDLARQLGDVRVANMVMLGALNRFLELVSRDRILTTLAGRLSGKAEALMPLNQQALTQGEQAAESTAGRRTVPR